MSRTIRRPQRHLIIGWLSSVKLVPTQSQDPWRALQFPKRYESKIEPVIVRRLQSEVHRFHTGIGSFNKRRYNKSERQRTRLALHPMGKLSWEDFLQPEFYIPYM